jgi:hypothetical protein
VGDRDAAGQPGRAGGGVQPGEDRAIAEAKVKTDKVDVEILAQLLAADYLPAVWRPDPATAALRRQVPRRAQIVRQRTRLKNQVHAWSTVRRAVAVHGAVELVEPEPEPEPTTVLGMDETRFGRPRWLPDGHHDDGRAGRDRGAGRLDTN